MYRSHVLVCGGTGCTSSNSQKIIEAMEAEIKAKGLENEVRTLLDSGKLPRDSTAAQAIGYKELIEAFDEKCSLSDAVSTIKQSSRRYAKRQLTWFRRNSEVNWLDSDSNFEVIVNIAEKLLT